MELGYTVDKENVFLINFNKDKNYKVSIDISGRIIEKEFESYDNIIVGVSTWFDGELPSYWDEVKPELESLNLKGKKVAVFGLGDQVKYPENFIDGVGILAEIFESAGAKVVGYTSAEGYKFESSQALKDGKFVGLAIDKEHQSKLTDERVKNWVEQLKKEFD